MYRGYQKKLGLKVQNLRPFLRFGGQFFEKISTVKCINVGYQEKTWDRMTKIFVRFNRFFERIFGFSLCDFFGGTVAC